MIDINIVSTGSIGNCIIIDGVIAIDCGIKRKDFMPFIDEIDHILISHEHGDHLNIPTLNYIRKERPSLLKYGVHLNQGSLNKIEKAKRPEIVDLVTQIIDGDTEKILKTRKGAYHLRTYPLFHDVENQGFILTAPTGETLIHATDTMTMSGAPENEVYDYLLIEGNWDEDTLIERMCSDNPNEAFRASRNLRHLSVQMCHKFMINHSHPQSKLYQLHESSEFGINLQLDASDLTRV